VPLHVCNALSVYCSCCLDHHTAVGAAFADFVECILAVGNHLAMDNDHAVGIAAVDHMISDVVDHKVFLQLHSYLYEYLKMEQNYQDRKVDYLYFRVAIYARVDLVLFFHTRLLDP